MQGCKERDAEHKAGLSGTPEAPRNAVEEEPFGLEATVIYAELARIQSHVDAWRSTRRLLYSGE
jgi:hypothetical protein